MALAPFTGTLDPTPAPTPFTGVLDPPESSTILQETAKAVPRVVGGIAEELGQAGQYLTGDRVGKGLRTWGENLQQQNAMTPGFPQAHPLIAEAGQAAEGVARFAPYAAMEAAPLTRPVATGLLAGVAGASQGQRSYESGLQAGLSPDEALQASKLPAITAGVGMAAMPGAIQGARGLLPKTLEVSAARAAGRSIFKPLVTDLAAGTAAGTAVMQSQAASTVEAEKLSGARPEADPVKEVLANPKAWASAALTGGMFETLGMAGKVLQGEKLKEALNHPDVPKEVKAQIILATEAELKKEDPKEAAQWRTQELTKLHADEPLDADTAAAALGLTDETPTKTPSAQTQKDDLTSALAQSLETGETATEALQSSVGEKAGDRVDKLLSAQAEPAQEAAVPPEQRIAELALKTGRTQLTDDMVGPVSDLLAAEGKQLVDQGLERSGSVRRHNFSVEDIPEEPVPTHQMVNPATGELVPVPADQLKMAREQGYYLPEEESDAFSVGEAAQLHGSDSTQPGVREEGGSTPVGGEGLRAGGQGEEAVPTEAQGAQEAGVSHAEQEAGAAQGGEAAGAVAGGAGQDGQLGGEPQGDDGAAGRGEETAGSPEALKDGEARQLYDDNPNLQIARKGDKVVVADMSHNEMLGMARLNGKGEFSGWLDGKAPPTPAERVQLERAVRGHLGDTSIRFNRVEDEGKPWDTPQQDVTSASTSISYPDPENKAPILFKAFKEGKITLGPKNADIGGGRFDQITKWLKGKGVDNVVWDRFNRDEAHNADAQSKLAGGQADTATVSNVLNVIPDETGRLTTIATAHDAIKDGGKAYFSMYTAPKAGEVKGRDAYQVGKKTADYIPEIEKVFGEGNVVRKGDVVIATKQGGGRFSKVSDLTFASVPRGIVDTMRRIFEENGRSLVKGADSISDEEYRKIPDRVWNNLPGLQESLDRETKRVDAKISMLDAEFGLNSRQKEALEKNRDRHADVIRKTALADYVMSRLNRSPSFDEILDAKKEVVKRLADAGHLEADARKRGITVDDLTSRLEVQLDSYNRILNRETTYAEMQAPLTADTIKAHLDPILKTLKTPVEIVDKAGDIPGLSSDVKFNGAFHNGKIYLNAEHLGSLKEAERVLLEHEIAHSGLRGMLGRDFDAVMAKAYADKSEDVRAFAKEKGIDTSTKAGKLEAAEEYIVSLAEHGETNSTWQKFVSTVKEWLQKAGFSMKLSDADLREMVNRAKGMELGEGATYVSPTEGTRFERTAKDFSGAPEDQARGLKTLGERLSNPKRALENLGNAALRAVLPIDRTIKSLAARADFDLIKPLLEQHNRLTKERAAKSGAYVLDTHAHTQAFEKRVKDTKIWEKAFKLSLYEMTVDRPLGDQWTEKSWAEAGKEEQTGKTLGQALQDVKPFYDHLHANPEDLALHRQTVQHMKEDYQTFRQSKEAPLFEALGQEVAGKAKELLPEYQKALADPDVLDAFRAKHGGDTVAAVEAFDAIACQFPTLKGDFMPLVRRPGRYEVRGYEVDPDTGEPGKTAFMKYTDSDSEARALHAEQVAQGRHAEINTPLPQEPGRLEISPGVMQKILGSARDKMTPEQFQDFSDRMGKLWAQTLSPRSFKADQMHRAGIEGYETNPMVAYATYRQRAHQAIADSEYNSKIAQNFLEMQNQTKAAWGQNTHKTESLMDMNNAIASLYKSHMIQSKVPVSKIAQSISKFTALWYLSSPRMYAVMWAHPFVKTLPKMAGRYGTSAYPAYLRAAKEFMGGQYSTQKIADFAKANTKELHGREVSLPDYALDLVKRGRDGDVKATRELNSIYQGLSDSNQKLFTLKLLALQGSEDVAMSHTIHDMIAGASKAEEALNEITEKGMTMVHHADSGSRRAAAIAAFGLEYAKTGDVLKANDYAWHVIDDTLADFSKENRPPILASNVGRVIGQFQMFRLHTVGKVLQLTKDAWGTEFKRAMDEAKTPEAQASAIQGLKEARKEYAFMLGSTFAMAGAAGTPLAMLADNTVTEALWDAVAFLCEDPDHPWNPKADFEEGLKDAVGEDMSKLFFKGIPGLFNVDASRMGGIGSMAHVLEGEVPPGLHGTQKAYWYANRILGPSWGIVTNGMKTVDDVKNGDMGAFMKDGSPKIIADLYRAYDLGTKGVSAPNGRQLMSPEDVSPWSVTLMMAGINPMEVTLAKEEAREISNLSAVLTQRRGALLTNFTKAQASGDLEAREDALDAISKWGQTNPKLAISQHELASAVKRGLDKQSGKMGKKEKIVQEMVAGGA